MKFNWGTGITIGIILFMAFILQYVIRVQVDSSYDNELVTEDYYQAESLIDSKYEKKQNANNLSVKLLIKNVADGVVIEFPSDFDFTKITGEIFLYRPSNEKLDQTLPLKLTSNSLLIPKAELVNGRWDVSVDWTYDGISYLSSESFNLN
ncbi:cytochrome C oxidase Cbb3 [Paenimyroides tangerinum]|uniref:Cytochrome C oxidase Cbb3 n=1 Tax=Paenimyroides tangerinum TaxID=2488728 RepID=A0A3P3WBS4_9FLAO|nr:FixH family protein [Paenimyroides tangerinum]RRJ92631.1 cytochrome C oxidase Cbb3 [Paenimyroides tangerinum]